MFWYRKYQESPNTIARYALYRLSRKYGLEISSIGQIGNSVFVGINATIVGKVRIGSDVLIAPNSYVNFDVPDHSIVIGNPGIIYHSDSAIEGYVNFLV